MQEMHAAFGESQGLCAIRASNAKGKGPHSTQGPSRFQFTRNSTVFDIALTAKALSGLRMRPAGPWGQEGLRGLRDRRWDRLSC